MTTVTFDVNEATGRFAVLTDGKIAFESYHLDAKERASLKGVIERVDERAWGQGHDAAVMLVKEFSAALHLVRAPR